MKLKSLLYNVINEAENKAEVNALDAAMGQSFKALGSALEANKEELQQSIQKADIKVNEAITAISVVGMLLAAPKVVELLAKGLGGLIKTYKKFFTPKEAQTEEEQVEVVKKIIDFTHKWHKQYIKGLKWILKVSGLFDKAGIKGETNQTKAAEMLYYTIIAGLAAYSGVSAVGAFKEALAGSAGQLSLGALETAMAGVKSGEVLTFLSTLGLKVAK